MISVIMLTYNREKYVARMIECILRQTYCDFELIIIDNGSIDDSGIIAEKYAQSDNRVRVKHIGKSSIGQGRNVGLDEAMGGHIAFVDDDDWLDDDYLEFHYNLISEYDADVSICGSTGKEYAERRVMDSYEAVVELLWRRRYNMAFPTKMFKQELICGLRFPKDDKYDDISTMYRALANASVVAYDGTPKYTFFRHEGNNSAWTTNHSLLDRQILSEYLNTYHRRTIWLGKKFPDHTDTFKYFEWSFMISMIEKIDRLNIPECEKELLYMKRELDNHREEFCSCPEIQDFEKGWMERYV